MSAKKQQYMEAINHIENAIEILNTIGKEDQKDYDADGFAANLKCILSSDGGECGMYNFIQHLESGKI